MFDGQMAYEHSGKAPVDAQNSDHRAWADENGAVADGWETDGEMVRSAYTLHAEDEDFGQAGALVRSVFNEEQRASLVDQVAGSLLGGVRSRCSSAPSSIGRRSTRRRPTHRDEGPQRQRESPQRAWASADRLGRATAFHVGIRFAYILLGARCATREIPMRTVREIIAADSCWVPADMPLERVAEELSERQVGAAPVCAPDGTILGMVSKTDLIELYGRAQKHYSARDAMTPEVLSVKADEPMDCAIRNMAFEGVHQLVVLDDDERFVGVVTSMDILRELAGYPRQSGRILAAAP